MFTTGETVSDRESNRPVTYNENFGTFESDPNQFGTHEMMEFCEMIGAKPWFNINMMTGSPAEMREWMEYCNRRESTTLTRERKVNGHEVPFQVEYWGIGNEVWDGGGKMTPQMYADEYRKFTVRPVHPLDGGDQAFSAKMHCQRSGWQQAKRACCVDERLLSRRWENTVCHRFTAMISIFTTGI